MHVLDGMDEKAETQKIARQRKKMEIEIKGSVSEWRPTYMHA